jgi:hypothetical protein
MRWAASMHSVGYISYYDVAHCASKLKEPYSTDRQRDIIRKFWDQTYHPTWRTHQLIADAVEATLFRDDLPSSCSTDMTTMAPPDLLSSLEICTSPSTIFSAPRSIFDETQISVHGDWKMVEDRVGKPGWISRTVNSSISFGVKFGVHPRLMVTYLRSYEKLGDVTMSLNGRSVQLHGLWEEPRPHVSQSYLTLFQAFHEAFQTELGDSGLVGFNIQPESHHVVTFSTTQNEGELFKFKIIEVAAC